MTADFEFNIIDDGTSDTAVEVTCNRCEHSFELRYNPDGPNDRESWDCTDDGIPIDPETGEPWDRVQDALDMAESDVESDGCGVCDDNEIDCIVASTGYSNTALTIYRSGKRVWTLYNTPIVTVYPSGRVMLNTGGYFTSTTKRRMNKILVDEKISAVVYQKKWNWIVQFPPNWNCPPIPFVGNAAIIEKLV